MTKQSEATQGGAPAAAAPQGVNLQLIPAGTSDQPVFANLTLLHPGSGVAFIDFGFVDPGVLAQLSQLARAGQKVPERLGGRLAVRVALGYDTLAQMHQQTGQLLAALARPPAPTQ
jgi:hypothetical protein